MKVFVLMNQQSEFICKKAGKVYISTGDVDKALTYRREADAENMLSDVHYWEHREINISEFKIRKVDLSFRAVLS